MGEALGIGGYPQPNRKKRADKDKVPSQEVMSAYKSNQISTNNMGTTDGGAPSGQMTKDMKGSRSEGTYYADADAKAAQYAADTDAGKGRVTVVAKDATSDPNYFKNKRDLEPQPPGPFTKMKDDARPSGIEYSTRRRKRGAMQ